MSEAKDREIIAWQNIEIERLKSELARQEGNVNHFAAQAAASEDAARLAKNKTLTMFFMGFFTGSVFVGMLWIILR